MITEFLGWVEQTSLSTAIRQSDWAVMALEAVHLLGLAALGGAALIVALAAVRRSGLRGITSETLVRDLRLLALTGLALLAVSGTLIALSMPFKYYNNIAFEWKMVLLAASLFVSAFLVRQPSRALAILSLILWTSVGFSGRLVGFL